MDELLQCPSCGKEFSTPRPPHGAENEAQQRQNDGAGVLPSGLLLQAAAHGIASLLLLGCLLQLALLADGVRSFPPNAADTTFTTAALGLVLFAATVIGVIANLLAGCYFVLAPTPARARPLGLAQFLFALFEVVAVLVVLDSGSPPEWGGRERGVFFFGKLTILMGMEVARLCLLGWHLRAATPPGSNAGALPLAITTPALLLLPWVGVLMMATRGRDGFDVFAAVFLVVGSALGVYVWSSTVLLRLRGQLLRSARMGV